MSVTDIEVVPQTWNELFDADGVPRPFAAAIVAELEQLGLDELRSRQTQADLEILSAGVTFTVYSDGKGIDRAWPFDVIPRIIAASEWRRIEAGLIQRLRALNMFIDDLYHDQRIVADGVVPGSLFADSTNFRPECRGFSPAHGVWAHISGSDLVRDAEGTMYVLEDNLRVPSGVSYVLENRLVSKRTMADLFEHYSILPVDDYPTQLLRLLTSLAPDIAEPRIAVLTPGVFNSAYFEHAFLAQRMGVDLVEGSDLVVDRDDYVYVRTIAGLQRVDVIYRRVDDMFLDPEVFRPDSTLGVPGLIRAWRAGKVAIANAPGAGVADDKVVYAWVPDVIRYYLREEPLMPNVPTLRCMIPDERREVIANMREMVIKPANESGGYGLLIGSQATDDEIRDRITAIKADPRNWVAQPILSLSTAPTLCGDTIGDRHLDLRPFILTGATSSVTAGGLTRVALNEGSLIVNSSQGGGSKDTWIIEDELVG
jgi:uncharacterized circularly permuted ATP-grasp superfamily protein